jgi:hypothetical protein
MKGRSDRLRAAQDALQPLHPLKPDGVFDRIFVGLAGEGPKPERIMMDATHLKAHRTAASLLERGCSPPYRANQGRAELEAPHRLRR